jgi:ribonucleoside-diphosphate reductase alpha chain
MWEHKDSYNGISVLPYDGGTYVQAPFEDTDEATYFRLIEMLKDINLKEIIEEENNTTLVDELACAADGCVVV